MSNASEIHASRLLNKILKAQGLQDTPSSERTPAWWAQVEAAAHPNDWERWLAANQAADEVEVANAERYLHNIRK